MKCRITGSERVTPLLSLGSHPVSHHFLKEAGARERAYPFDLFYCEDSGLVQLRDVIPPDELYGEYFNLSSSKRCPHIPRLVKLIEGLKGLRRTSRILEVACNDGHFLQRLRDAGYANVQGIEPARDAWQASVQRGIPTTNAYFTREAAAKLAGDGAFDLLIARHVIEHITDLDEFFGAMTSVLRRNAYVLLEVPDFEFCMRTLDYTALWEQHVNYFGLGSFSLLLARHGIEVLQHGRATFSGKALFVVGRYTGGKVHPDLRYLRRTARLARNYAAQWPAFKERLHQTLAGLRERHGTVSLYGAGCRSCSLVNFAGVGGDIDYFVDDEPKKQALFMPGSRLPIYPRARLSEEGGGACILGVNAENESRVLGALRSDGVKGVRCWSAHPPSERLLPFWKSMAKRA
jgi:SAM-dependent methyltransferase